MFQHVIILISFIFALALAHVFSSASLLILHRDRVLFSGLLATTMLNAALGIIISWLFLWQLEEIKRWSLGEVLLQLLWVIPQYFTVSLVAMPPAEAGALDMIAFYERQRRVIYAAFIVLFATESVEVFGDRHNLASWTSNEWVAAALTNASLGVCAAIAGWAKPRWLQWLGVVGMLAANVWFLVGYTLS
jgi:hypothetical protein